MPDTFSATAILSCLDRGFSSGLKNAASVTDKLSSKLKGGLGFGVMAGLGSKAFSTISSGIGGIVSDMNEASAAWKTFDGNMKMNGHTEKDIQKTQKSLQKFATQTIYSASDMATTYAQLDAVGIKNTTSLVKGFGGLASAAENPTQAMKTLSQQATQMAAKPKVQWADFKLMLEQTPAGISAVAKTMGKSTSQLIQDVNAGKLKTQDFFKAIEKTGTNKAFTKLATQYKTVGQAMDGLKETASNKLGPAFKVLSDIGISAVSKITDSLGNINGDKLGKGISSFVKKLSKYWTVLKTDAGIVKDALGKAFSAIGESMGDMNGSFGSAKNVRGFSQILGAITQKITEFAGFLEDHADTIAKLIQNLPKLAAAFVGLKVVKSVLPGVSALAGLFGKKGGLGGNTKMTSIISLKNGLADLQKSAGIALVVASVALLAKSLTGLASLGTTAVAPLAAFGVVVGGLAIVFGQMGTKLQASAPGIIAFAAAVSVMALAMTPLASTGTEGAIAMAAFGVVIAGLVIVFAIFGGALNAAIPGMLALGATALMVGAGAALASVLIRALTPFIKQLGDTVSQVAGAISGAIVRVLGAVGRLVTRISNAVTQIMGAFGKLVGAVADAVSKIIGAVGNLVTKIADAVSQIVTSIGDTLCNIMKTAGDTISGVIDSISKGFDTLCTGVGNVIKAIGEGLNSVLSGVADVIQSIGTAALNAGTGFERMATGIAKITALNILDMAASLAAVATGVGAISLASGGLESAGTGLVNLGNGLLVVSTYATAARDRMAELPAAIAPLSTALPAAAAVLFVSMTRVGAAVAILAAAFSGVGGRVAVFAAILGAIAGRAIATAGALRSAGAAMGGLAGRTQTAGKSASGLKSALNGVAPAFSRISGVAKGAMASMVSSVRSGAQQAKSAGKQIGASISSSVSAGMGKTASAVKSAFSRISLVFKSSANAAKAAGKQIGVGTYSGIQSGMGKVPTAAKSAMSKLTSAVRSGGSSAVSAAKRAATSIVSALRSAESGARRVGVYIGQGLANGMASELSRVRSIASKLASAAAKAIAAKAKVGSPSRVTHKLGAFIGMGLSNGIKSMTRAVGRVSAALANTVDLSIRKEGEIHSPSKKTHKSGRHFGQGLANGLLSKTKAVTSTSKKLAKAAMSALKKGTTANNGKYKSLGASLGDKYKTSLTDNMNKALKSTKSTISKYAGKSKSGKKLASRMYSKYSSAIKSGVSKAIKDTQNALTKISEAAQKKYDDIISKRTAFYNKLADVGSLYTVDSYGQVSLKNFSAGTKQINALSKNMEKLKKSLPEGLMDEITQLSTGDALAYTSKLLKMNSKDLVAYGKTYTSYEKAAKTTSNKFYQNRLDTVKKNFDKAIKTTQASLQKQLKSVGSNAMAGFVKGMKSQTKNLSKSSKRLAAVVVSAFKKALKIHSPSKVFMSLGKYTGLGAAKGIEKSGEFVKKAMAAIMDVPDVRVPAISLPDGGQLSSKYDYYTQADFNVEVVTNLDGKVVSKTIAPHMQKDLDKLTTRDNRKYGKR